MSATIVSAMHKLWMLFDAKHPIPFPFFIVFSQLHHPPEESIQMP